MSPSKPRRVIAAVGGIALLAYAASTLFLMSRSTVPVAHAMTVRMALVGPEIVIGACVLAFAILPRLGVQLARASACLLAVALLWIGVRPPAGLHPDGVVRVAMVVCAVLLIARVSGVIRRRASTG